MAEIKNPLRADFSTSDSTGHIVATNLVNSLVNELVYDSGWRDISGLLPAGSTVKSSGYARLRREGRTARISFMDVTLTGAYKLPAGFAGGSGQLELLTVTQAGVPKSGNVTGTNLTLPTGVEIRATGRWRTGDDIPSALPGADV